MFGQLTKLIGARINRLIACLIAGLIFITPTNWFIKLAENQAYVHGLFSDYLLVKIYVTDGLVLILFVLLMVTLIQMTTWTRYVQSHKRFLYLYFLLSLVLILIPLSAPEYGLVKIVSASRWVVLGGMIVLLKQWWLHLDSAMAQTARFIIGSASLLTVLFQSSVGLYQFIFQKSLLGYAFLGETQLNSPTNIAHFIWRGHELIPAYGTTAHPNILAGCIVILLVLGWKLLDRAKAKNSRAILWLATGFGGLTLMITASFSGILAGVLAGGGCWIFRQVKIKKFIIKLTSISVLGWILILGLVPIVLSMTTRLTSDNTSVLRRVALNQAASQIILDHPLLGVGPGLFTTQLDRYLPRFEPVIFLQPVHHVPLLFLAQTGLLGCVWVWVLWQLIKPSQHTDQNSKLLWSHDVMTWGFVILPILALDHYLLSLQTGLILSALVLGLGSDSGDRQ